MTNGKVFLENHRVQLLAIAMIFIFLESEERDASFARKIRFVRRRSPLWRKLKSKEKRLGDRN